MSIRSLPLSLLLVLVLIATARGQSRPAGSPITVSPETTLYTEPLRPDGTVDYLSAVNAVAAEGVTPERNLAVELLAVLGPTLWPAGLEPLALERLGVEQLPERPRFVPPDAVADADALKAQCKKALQAAWRVEHLPVLAEWLDRNAPALDTLVQAVHTHDQYYLPILAPPERQERGGLSAVEMPQLSRCRWISQALAARALLRFEQGDFENTRKDLRACYRFARLTSRDGTLIGRLVAMSGEDYANDALQALAVHERLTAPQARALMEDIAALPAPRDVRWHITHDGDAAPRSFVCRAAMGHNPVTAMIEANLLKPEGSIRELQQATEHLASAEPGTFDWDGILRHINQWQQAQMRARAVESPRRRQEADDQFVKDRARAIVRVGVAYQALRQQFPTDEQLEEQARKDPSTRELVTELMALGLFEQLTVSTRIAVDLQDAQAMETQLAQLALALAVCRAERGEYPAQLDAVAGELPGPIPPDRFAEAPLQYRREGDGYVLYSIGLNFQDDGGQQTDNARDGDIVVRVP